MKLKSNMPDNLTPKTPSNVIEANIPIRKPVKSDDAAPSSDAGIDESRTRRIHRQRMKAFLAGAKSVA